MTRLLTRSILIAPAMAAFMLLGTAPVHAETTGTEPLPPTVGLVAPTTFKVNNLLTIQASVTSDHGIDGCHLLIDGSDAGLMKLLSGEASLTKVFTTPATRMLQVRCSDMTGTVGYSPVTALRAEAPDAPPSGYFPAGFSAGMLVRLSCLPNEINDEHCQSVYYVGRDIKRHAFQSDAAYRSWYPAMPQVMDVSLEALASLPLGQPISVKPGGSGVRFLSQPDLDYAVSGPLYLRRFADQTIEADALGSDWKDRVDVLTDAFYGNFIFGEPLTNAGELPTVSTPDDVIER